MHAKSKLEETCMQKAS